MKALGKTRRYGLVHSLWLFWLVIIAIFASVLASLIPIKIILIFDGIVVLCIFAHAIWMDRVAIRKRREAIAAGRMRPPPNEQNQSPSK